MKFNKFVLVLATLALTGCGLNEGSSETSPSQPEELKQPKITAEKAKELSESIFDFIDDSYDDVEIPDECTLRINSVSNELTVVDGKTTINNYSYSYFVVFSQSKGIYYSESNGTQTYNDLVSTHSYKQWAFIEGDTAYGYSIETENGESRYGVETAEASEINLKEFASENITLENSDVIYDNIREFQYSDVTPTLDTPIENIEISFESYYGSKNDTSLQVIENLSASCPDYEAKGVRLSTSETSRQKIWIENYLTYNYECNQELHQQQLNTENKTDLLNTYTYVLSEVAESVPELDKTLFTK